MIYSTDNLKSRLDICANKNIVLASRVMDGGNVEIYSSYVITGTTGWLGRHIVADLVEQIEGIYNEDKDQLLFIRKIKIILPVRAKNVDNAKDRLEESWRGRDILLSLLKGEREVFELIIIPIDSLSVILPSLDYKIDCIINSAASMSLAQDLDEIWSDNVLAVQQLWTWGGDHQIKRFDHISTLSVFVASDAKYGVLMEDDPLEISGRLYGGYAASKWCAEAFLMNARQDKRKNNPKLSIHRLGLASYSTYEGFALNDGVRNWIEASVEYGCLQQLDITTQEQRDYYKSDLTLVDYASLGIVRCGLLGYTGVYHWAGQRAISLGVWMDIINQVIKSKPKASWPVNEQLGKNATRALLPLINYKKSVKIWWQNIFQSCNHTYDTRYSSSVLKRTNWSVEFLNKMVDSALLNYKK